MHSIWGNGRKSCLDGGSRSWVYPSGLHLAQAPLYYYSLLPVSCEVNSSLLPHIPSTIMFSSTWNQETMSWTLWNGEIKRISLLLSTLPRCFDHSGTKVTNNAGHIYYYYFVWGVVRFLCSYFWFAMQHRIHFDPLLLVPKYWDYRCSPPCLPRIVHSCINKTKEK